ncbi:MAG: hypothetical protein KAT28_02485 [Candidatus Aenigmarchaeota archaeon]|nr:hypothetical protein [Candidatus Aenigmarchaeota archaeon]
MDEIPIVELGNFNITGNLILYKDFLEKHTLEQSREAFYDELERTIKAINDPDYASFGELKIYNPTDLKNYYKNTLKENYGVTNPEEYLETSRKELEEKIEYLPELWVNLPYKKLIKDLENEGCGLLAAYNNINWCIYPIHKNTFKIIGYANQTADIIEDSQENSEKIKILLKNMGFKIEESDD